MTAQAAGPYIFANDKFPSSPQHKIQDRFFVLLTAEDDDDLDVFQVCEEEAPPSGSSFIIKEPEGPLIYFDTVASSCLFWNNTSEKWSSEGCEV